MRRVLKYLFSLILLIVVIAVATVFLIPRDKIVALAADQVRAATGRELVLEGGISPSFWPVLGVRTGAVRLSNADWAEAPDMVSASAAEIGVELVPLFSGEVKVTTLRLVDPVVALEINGKGVPNWQFGEAAEPAPAAATGMQDLKVSLPEAVIANGRVSFHDARNGQRIELSELDLTAGLAGLEAPLKLDGAGVWNGKRTSLKLVVDTPARAMAGARTRIELALKSDPATVEFDGDITAVPGALPVVDGKLSADVPSPSRALAWASGAAAPAGLAEVGKVKLSGNVASSAASLRLTASGSVGFKGRDLGFSLTAEGGAGWAEKRAFAIAASARSEGMFEASFNGPVTAGETLAAEGPVKARVSDLRGLVEWAGGAPLAAPPGTLVAGGLEGQLRLAGDKVRLSALTASLDGTQITGDASATLGARPYVSARLQSGPLDLSPFLARGEGGTAGGGGAGGWSTEPLDLAPLRAMDADVSLEAAAIDLGEIELGRSAVEAKLRGGRLDMTIARLDAYGGGANGTLSLTAGDTAAMATDLTVTNVQLRPLLSAMGVTDRLEGTGAFRLRTQGRGRSMDQLMRSLSGDGGIDLSDGAIYGVNLASVIRNLTGQGGGVQKTDFSALTGTFTITDGVIHNTDFSLLGPLLRVIGAGTVDLGGQSQNFRLEPTAVASLAGQGGALEAAGLGVFPILITGTWAKPVIRPDLTNAIQGLMTDPSKTVDAVTGLVKGADAGQAAGALLGAVTGGGTTEGAGATPEAALGQAIGGLIGGQGPASTTETGTADSSTAAGVAAGGVIGGLIGALTGGGKDKKADDQPSAAQGTTTDQAVTGQGTGGRVATAPEPAPIKPRPAVILDASALAPEVAPLPVPPPPDREALAALPGDRPSDFENEPAGMVEPAPATPTEPAATATTAGAAPSTEAPAPAAEAPATEAPATEEQPKKRKVKPLDVLKGILKQ